MEYLPTKIPRKALEDLSFKLIPPETPEDTTISLIISIDDKNINIREFGIYSYSHTRNKQLLIKTIKKGSLELEFYDTLANFGALRISFIWLILFYLPYLIKQLTSTLKDISIIFKEIEEGKLIRIRRKILREKLMEDEKLGKMDPKKLNQIAKLVDKIAEIIKKEKRPAIRFSINNIEKIEIKIKNKGKT